MIKRVASITLGICLLVAAVAGCSDSGHPPAVSIGAANTPTMRVMAQLYAAALSASGTPVSTTVRTGDDRELLRDMDSATVDLFPTFSGSLLTQLAPQVPAVSADDVYDQLNRALPQGVSVGDSTVVSATPQVFAAAPLAERTQATDLSGCGRLPAGLPVVVLRVPGPAIMAAFAAAGCRLGPVQTVASPAAAVARIATGDAVGVLSQLDVGGLDQRTSAAVRALPAGGSDKTNGTDNATSGKSAGTTPGPRAQLIVPVLRSAAFTRDQVKTVNKVAGQITTADLAAMVTKMEQGSKPHDLAVEWLAEHEL